MKQFRLSRGAVQGVLLSFLALGANMGSAAMGSAALPDLIINRSRLAAGIEIREQSFSSSDCAVIEGCIKSAGKRRLLLFEVAFVNIGKADLVIGSPHDNPSIFEFSPCHGHHHLSGAASYELINSAGQSLNVTRKQAFCLRDNSPYNSSSGPSRGYDCDYQGITAGWEDIYPKSLDCQWLDITDLAGGAYTLKVTVNPIRVFREGNYANNAASVTVQIPPKPSTRPPPSTTNPPKKTPPPKFHPPKKAPPKVQPLPKKTPPKHVKKPKSDRGQHKGWHKPPPIKKPVPKPKYHDDDDDGGDDDDDGGKYTPRRDDDDDD